MENKVLRTKGSGCEFCNTIYDGYTVKDHPLIYYSKSRFVLTSQYHGHGGTKELEDIKYCPYCASNLYDRLI